MGIIGLGYVGLPLAVEFAKSGLHVTGFDVDSRKVTSINQGRSYIIDVPSETITELRKAKTLSATSDFRGLEKMDAIIICVPTPLKITKDPDLSAILSAVEKVAGHIQKGQLIVLESTTYPGTTREIVLPALAASGMTVGKDFFLAFSPERVDPANKKYNIRNTPKVVGGITTQCTASAESLYSKVVDKVVVVSSPECAEIVKLLENTFRAVNIALVNEFALMCSRLNLNTWEVIDAASTKPFGFMPFYPGPGIGGHCIPLDPHYLSWKLKSFNFFSRFIDLASDINASMPMHLVEKVGGVLNEKGKSIKGSRILILGVAYKKDVGDWRESPALDVMEKLLDRKAALSYHDPYIPALSLGKHTFRSKPLTPAVLRSHDCVVVVTNHSVFNMKSILQNSSAVVDARNATKGINSSKITRL